MFYHLRDTNSSPNGKRTVITLITYRSFFVRSFLTSARFLLLSEPKIKRLLYRRWCAICFDDLNYKGKPPCVTQIGVMNGPLKFLTARKILPLLALLAKFKRVLACPCSLNFCSCSHARKAIFLPLLVLAKKSPCSPRPFVTPQNL